MLENPFNIGDTVQFRPIARGLYSGYGLVKGDRFVVTSINRQFIGFYLPNAKNLGKDYASGIKANWPARNFIKVNKMKEKIVAGYKLKEAFVDKEIQIVNALGSAQTKFMSTIWGNFQINSGFYKKAIALGVLDLWFEPVYEPEKPLTITVSTNAGDVIVSKENLVISGENPVSVAEAQGVFKAMRLASCVTRAHQVNVTQFAVGCKIFNFSDIAKLEAAIKQVL